MKEFADITGKTIERIEGVRVVEGVADAEEMFFFFADGTAAMLYHEQDCCEYVRLHDIAGSLEDIVGTPILKAEESSNSDEPAMGESWTWTFYHIVTAKGYVTLRWLGESNGYYSESVSFREICASAVSCVS